MAKKFSGKVGLHQLSKSTNLYSRTTSSGTKNSFNLPDVRDTTTPSKRSSGKTLKDYTSKTQVSQRKGMNAPCPARHLVIRAGEYIHGSFDLGSYPANSFWSPTAAGHPVVIELTKYAHDPITGAIDPSFSNVVSATDAGGYYTDINGTIVNSAMTPTVLDGADVYPANEKIHLVYKNLDLNFYATVRFIDVVFSGSALAVQFHVLIPGMKMTHGWGNSLAGIMGPGNAPALNTNAYTCANQPDLEWQSSSNFFTHTGHYINGGGSSYFTGYSTTGSQDNGLHALNATRMGIHHDDTNLWNEGFQPTDGSGQTLAHQDTWPVGLFWTTDSLTNDEQNMWKYQSHGSSIGQNYITELWEQQYNGSSLVPSNYSTTVGGFSRGNPLRADSIQHFEWLHVYQSNRVVDAPNCEWLDQFMSTEYNLFNGNIGGMGNTAHDSGNGFGVILGQLMKGPNNGSNILYCTPSSVSAWWSGSGTLISEPYNRCSSPAMVHTQIYTTNLACVNCTVTGGSIPIDLCTDEDSTEFWQYTGVDCLGAAVPADLMSGTATLGLFGCVGCDYELVAVSACCISGAPTGAGPVQPCCCEEEDMHGNIISTAPQFSFSNINAPAVLGGNDAYADIEIDPANSGSEAWVYLIEPVANTSAGLGKGAIDTYTILLGGSQSANGIVDFTQTSSTGSGTGANVRVQITGLTVTTIDRISSRGVNHDVGDIITFTGSTGTFTLTVNSVKGVVVSIHGTGTSNGANTWLENPHEDGTATPADATNSTPPGLKATIGTGVFLQHENAIGLNNYSRNPHYSYPSVVNSNPGVPFKRCDFFDDMAFDTSTANGTVITGLEAGDYMVTVVEGVTVSTDSWGCFSRELLVIPPGVSNTNGCTDNNSGTNDGVGMNYDPLATVDDDSCIYCRASDGKIVDYTSTALIISGASDPGDIFTSINTSTTTAATTSVATDGAISYNRQLNTIFSYYTSLIVDALSIQNATFNMNVYQLASSAQTLVGSTQINATQVNATGLGFVYDFSDTNWTSGLTYGYYAIKSWVDDPDSASEQEQCFQVDYFIVPVLACLVGPPGMQVGITSDGVTITDPDLIVPTLPGSDDPCSEQCCEVPTLIWYTVPNGSTAGCFIPAFRVQQTCPDGLHSYVTSIVHEIEMLVSSSWVTLSSQTVQSGPMSAASVTWVYNVSIYNAYGPGDYRVKTTVNLTFPNGSTSSCIENTNIQNLDTEICGCTDPDALNYDPLATIDDGSCIYCIDGCMDSTALNYNSLATCEDDCIYCVWGCMDAAATNYNSSATCPDPCNYGVGCGCTDLFASNYGYDCDGNLVGFPPPCNDGCCLPGGEFCDNPPRIDSLITTEATCLPACDIPFIPGCTDPLANNYNSSATIDNGSCAYGFICIPTTMLDGSIKTETLIPDPVFEQWIEIEGPGGGGPIDGKVCTHFLCDTPQSYSAYGNTQIGIYWGPYEGTITDVTGIEDFCKLEEFISINNHITSIDFTNNPQLNLIQFYNHLVPSVDLSDNPLLTIVRLGVAFGGTNLPSIQGANIWQFLEIIPLASIDLGTINKVEQLYFQQCSVTSIDLTNLVDLFKLYAHNNQLTSLDISQNTKLELLIVNGVNGHYWDGTVGLGPTNNISSLDTSNNPLLTYLHIAGNAISSFDFTNNTLLESIYVNAQNSAGGGSNLTTLDVSMCPNLTTLKCSHNELTTLNLGSNIDLTTLNICAGNQWLNYNYITPTTMNLKVGVGDVPGTTGGSGNGGLQTRVEWAIANWSTAQCSSGFVTLDSTVNITT